MTMNDFTKCSKCIGWFEHNRPSSEAQLIEHGLWVLTLRKECFQCAIDKLNADVEKQRSPNNLQRERFTNNL